MRLVLQHKKSQIEVMQLVDKSASGLFAGVAGPGIEIADQKKEWDGSTMHFSFVGRMGFIALPLSGTIEVGDKEVIIDCELPSLVQQFIGESKLGSNIEKKVQLLLENGNSC
jgi:hypothetical protein